MEWWTLWLMLNRRLTLSTKIVIAFMLAVSLAFVCLLNTSTFKRIENRFLDYRYLLRKIYDNNGEGNVAEDIPIVIVLIDDESAMEYGYRSPTPRTLLADLIGALGGNGVTAIGIDVLLDRSYNEEEDILLEKVLRKYGEKVVLVDDPRMVLGGTGSEEGILSRFASHTKKGTGYSITEEDEYFRWVKLGAGTFAETIYRVYSGKPPDYPDALHLKENNFAVLLNFYDVPSRLDNETNHFSVISAIEALLTLSIPDPPPLFKDKIVLIGSGIEDLGDVFLTPLSLKDDNYRKAFGVECHAITLEMLIENDYLYTLSKTERIIWVFLFLLVVSLAFLLLRSTLALLSLPAFIVLWTVFVFVMFIQFNLVVPIATPWGATVIAFVVCQTFIQLTEQKQSRFLKKSFQHYISPELVNQLADGDQEVMLGGKKEELSMLFSDLEGFTTVSEKLEAEELIEFLHQYFDSMTNILLNEKGTLDKYIGDAIMAFYGAPALLPGHAVHACNSAILMQKKVSELNATAAKGWQNINVRIGINTGIVIVGNSGSKDRFNYTVIGDGVNLAARLEPANKLFGTGILISQSTLDSCMRYHSSIGQPDPFYTRELGLFALKGKGKPIAIYELVDFECNVNEAVRKKCENYNKALKAFYEKDFDMAKNLFFKVKEDYNDKASEFMYNHSGFLLEEKPDETWNGEITLLSK